MGCAIAITEVIIINHECPCEIGKSEFKPGTRLAESLVEIVTPRVRFNYPKWIGS